MVVVESVAELRSKGIRRVVLSFDAPIDTSVFERFPGVRDIMAENRHITISFDGQIASLLELATSRYTLVDVTTQEADLEEIFLTYYSDDAVTV